MIVVKPDDPLFLRQLPHSIINFISECSKKKNYNNVLAHCKRELIHGVWKVLLDNKFLDAYRNGIVVRCFDGKFCRLFSHTQRIIQKSKSSFRRVE